MFQRKYHVLKSLCRENCLRISENSISTNRLKKKECQQKIW